MKNSSPTSQVYGALCWHWMPHKIMEHCEAIVAGNQNQVQEKQTGLATLCDLNAFLHHPPLCRCCNFSQLLLKAFRRLMRLSCCHQFLRPSH